jgi:hypothetical protein
MSSDASSSDERGNPERRELLKTDCQSQHQSRGKGEESGDGPRVSSSLEIQEKLEYLAGCVMMGVTTPQKANAVRGIYNTILTHMSDTIPGSAGSLSDQDVLKMLRESPEMLAIVRPLLTKDQVALIVREASHD